LAARQEAEQTPEQPRRRIDMTAALRALTPTELQQLEVIVGKLEANARIEARERDGDDDEVSRRPFRRGRLRGEISASADVEAVDEVEAVAASGEVVADEIALNPGDISKPPE
jgi:hypothetical protein